MTAILLGSSSVAGLCMILGGVWLIYKEKLYIDRETKQIIEIEIPLVGKLKSNVPALGLFILGLFALAYPIHKATDTVQIVGRLEGDSFPVDVYAVVVSDVVNNPGEFSLSVPRVAGFKRYKVLYVAGPAVADDHADLARAEKGRLLLETKTMKGVVRYGPLDTLPPVPEGFRE